ncbi:MAG TPA: single-stranded DNA-binding protein [Ktedonobacterales bacterium]|jgi:single-strand DNA-binding protein|nr:single-stranded DNA-binding protein [Ktedonobacterales bacterium]
MLNKIMLIGNLGRDPEMSYTPAGKAITKFSLAVSRYTGGRETDERQKETQWFNIVAWEQLAERCSSYLHKGSKVYIEGRMTSRKYTNKDNLEVTAWEVVASGMEMLDSKASQEQHSAGGGYGDGDVGADDIPF